MRYRTFCFSHNQLEQVSSYEVSAKVHDLRRAGFSYSEKAVGFLDPTYLLVDKEPETSDEREGRWSVIDPTKEDTSRLAAITCWEVVQGFYDALPQLSSSNISSIDFHLWAGKCSCEL